MAKAFTTAEARIVGEDIGILWDHAAFSVEQFRRGLEVELEHGSANPMTDVTHDDPLATGRIAWAHLIEAPDYYTRLAEMEQEVEEDRALEEEQPVELR